MAEIKEPVIPLDYIDYAGELYIKRPPIEENCCQAILQASQILRIQAPIGMGKTWLLEKQILPYVRENRYTAVSINMDFDNDCFRDNKTFLTNFCNQLTDELDLPDKFSSYWNDILTPNRNTTKYFQEYILSNISNLVLAFDNVDVVFKKANIRDDFCTLLRNWQGKSVAKNRQNHLWKNVRFIITHTKRRYDSFDINASKLYNVSRLIYLRDFNRQEIENWIQKSKPNWSKNQLENLLCLMGGHPWLLGKNLEKLPEEGMVSLAQLLDRKKFPDIFEHLEKIRRDVSGDQNQNLARALNNIIEFPNSNTTPSEHIDELEDLGLVLRQNDPQQARIRNQLYAYYFRR